MGKKSGSQQQETENERALAEVSQAKHDRYKTLYREKEGDYIREVGRDTSALLRGRNTADVAQAEAGQTGRAISAGGGTGRAALGQPTGARTVAATEANKTALSLKDKGELGALRIGHDMAADAQNGLAAAARASSTEALGRVRANQIKQDGMGTALGTIAGAGMVYAMNKPKSTPKGTTKAEGDLYNGFLGVG